jgi:RNA polymerase sigma factor (TIGR02999 family)
LGAAAGTGTRKIWTGELPDPVGHIDELESPALSPHMGDVTVLLDRWNNGDEHALKELLGLVHGELRNLAGRLLSRERQQHTLQPTELVHEAYLRLEGLQEMRFDGRRHFYGAASEAMRRILVDHARHRNAEKRGGPDRHQVPLEAVLNLPLDLRVDFSRVDEALSELAAIAPEKARVVELRYFGGLSIQETAEVMDIAPATVKRHWTFARAWLYRALSA